MAALEVSILIRFNRIEPDVRDLISTINESLIDHRLLTTICKIVVRLWLEDALIDLIPRLINYGSLTILFQAASPVTRDSRPTDSEIWIMDRLALIYHRGSEVSEQEMQESLSELLDELDRAKRTAEFYLNDTMRPNTSFRGMLINLMN